MTQVYGLRAFRLPLSWDFQNISSARDELYNGVRYRRVTVWLPHGLAPNTSLAALKRRVRVRQHMTPAGGRDLWL